MERKGKLIIAVAVALAVALVAWVVLSVPDTPKPSRNNDLTKITYNGNTISEEKNGRTVWKVTADSITIDADTESVTLDGAEGVFYAEDGRTVTLHADHGKYDSASHDMELYMEGNAPIAVVTSDGISLTCNKIEWTNGSGMLAAIGKVKLTREEDHLTASGDHIESTDGFSKIKIKGNGRITKGVAD